MNKIALTPLAAALTAVAAAALAEPVVVTTPSYVVKDNNEPTSIYIQNGLLNDWITVEGGWTGSNISLASVGSDLTVTSKDNLLTIRNPSKTNNTYNEAVRLEEDAKITINADLDVSISNPDYQIIALRSNESSLTLNGDTKVEVNANSDDKKIKEIVVASLEATSGSEVIFNGNNTELHAFSNLLSQENTDYVYGAIVQGGSSVFFNSKESTVLNSEQYSGAPTTYTVFGIVINQGSNGGAYFNSDKVDIIAKSNSRSQGLTVYNSNEAVFKRGDINITAETSGDNQLYAVGIHANGSGAAVHIENAVDNFSINVVGGGSGSVNSNELQLSSVGAMVNQFAKMYVDSEHFNVSVEDQSEAGEDGGLGLGVAQKGQLIINSAETNISVSTEKNKTVGAIVETNADLVLGGNVQILATAQTEEAEANGLEVFSNSTVEVTGNTVVKASTLR